MHQKTTAAQSDRKDVHTNHTMIIIKSLLKIKTEKGKDVQNLFVTRQETLIAILWGSQFQNTALSDDTSSVETQFRTSEIQ